MGKEKDRVYGYCPKCERLIVRRKPATIGICTCSNTNVKVQRALQPKIFSFISTTKAHPLQLQTVQLYFCQILML